MQKTATFQVIGNKQLKADRKILKESQTLRIFYGLFCPNGRESVGLAKRSQ